MGFLIIYFFAFFFVFCYKIQMVKNITYYKINQILITNHLSKFFYIIYQAIYIYNFFCIDFKQQS